MKPLLNVLWRPVFGTVGVTLFCLSLPSPAIANDLDPFRSGSEARNMPPEIGRAMDTFFCDGDYVTLSHQLDAAREVAPEEPMVYVAYSALAYLQDDFAQIREMTGQTLSTAAALQDNDPLRSYLYTGVGHGMQAATIVVEEGIVLGLPKALPSLNRMFAEFRTAQQLAPRDSEVNFYIGFIDLVMTRHDRALEQFQTASSPKHMAYWGQALTYRDMDRYEEGLAAIQNALDSGCEHPEYYYLEGQLLRKLLRYEESVAAFDRSLAKSEILPQPLVRQIRRERESAYNRVQAVQQETNRSQ